jgi:Ca2+-binding EF-hand superfamily protein
VASYLSSQDEKAKISEIFSKMDKDKNGVLTHEEVRNGYQELYGEIYNEEEVTNLIKNVDINQNGLIDYAGISFQFSHCRVCGS